MATEEHEGGVPGGVEPSYRVKFRRVARLVRLLSAGKVKAVFLSGAPGIAKTTSCLRTLTGLGLVEGDHYIICKGHTSPMGLYVNLFQNNGDRLVIFDDCDAAFGGAGGNKDGINIAKSALDDKDKRVVSFMSSKLPPGIPTSFVYTGRVLFISNKRSSDIDEAIESRCHTIDLNLSREEIFSFIEYEVLPEPYLTTTRAQRQYVLWRMKGALKRSPAPVSVRLYKKLLDLWVHDERGHFNDHVDALVPKSDELSFVRSLLDRHETIGDAAKAFAAQTGKSERSFYLLKAKYRDVL